MDSFCSCGCAKKTRMTQAIFIIMAQPGTYFNRNTGQNKINIEQSDGPIITEKQNDTTYAKFIAHGQAGTYFQS